MGGCDLAEVMMRFLFVLLMLMPCVSNADGMPDEVKQQEQICAAAAPKKPQKNADIGAEYVAGKDVHGKDVVPADLSNVNAYPPVMIPITLNLAQKFGLNLPSGIELKPEAGQIEIFQDGRIRFNGEDILKRVQEHCETRAKEIKPNGQEPAHGIGSGETIKGAYPQD